MPHCDCGICRACYQRLYRAARRLPPTPRPCALCGWDFTPNRNDARFCSAACRQMNYRDQFIMTEYRSGIDPPPEEGPQPKRRRRRRITRRERRANLVAKFGPLGVAEVITACGLRTGFFERETKPRHIMATELDRMSFDPEDPKS